MTKETQKKRILDRRGDASEDTRGRAIGMAGMAIAIPIISKNSVSKKLKLNKLSKLLKLSIICCHKFKLDY